MKTASLASDKLRYILLHPSGGIVGLVEELFAVCPSQGFRFDWKEGECRAFPLDGESEELVHLPMRKSIFRAIIARLAMLCNERKPNSVSPYGGKGELSGANVTTVFQVRFTNTAEQQTFELMQLPNSNGKP